MEIVILRNLFLIALIPFIQQGVSQRSAFEHFIISVNPVDPVLLCVLVALLLAWTHLSHTVGERKKKLLVVFQMEQL